MRINYRSYTIVRIALVTILIAGIYNVHPAKAEAIDFGWVKGGGGPNFDYGTAIAVDASGNAYFTGFVTNGPGNEDGFLNKWDANGNPIWANFVAGPAHDTNHDVALDGDGNVYVSGVFSDTVEFDLGNPAGNLTSAGLTDIFIIKYDGDGNFIWVKGVGGTSSDGGYGITVDESSNVYLTGLYAGTVDFDPGSGMSNLTSAGFGDVFVLKLDGDGNFVWAKSMGGTGGENGFDIAVDGSGHVFTTGFFDETADFDPGAGTSNLSSAGQSDIFISKLDNSGDFLWARQVGGTDFDRGFEVTLDGSGNAYLAGHRNYDILISKLDQDGQFLWHNIMGGIGADAAYGIALDATGNVYVTGEFGGTVDFDSGAGTSNLTSAGGNDVFINKLDTDGNFLWAKNLGGTSMDLGEGIVVRNDGSLYLAGVFSDTVDFDLGPDTTTLTSGGGIDVFITKLSLTPQIHYVKWDATGADDGTSWEDAYTDIQSALSAASSGDEIWVAAGTYEPTTTTDRTISFTLKNGVAVYGGFAGTETTRIQRDYETNVTILSGDIGAQGDNSDNSYHVVVGSDTSQSTILDGFTVTAGKAKDTIDFSPESRGGGMYNYLGSPTVRNTIFVDNSAAFGGGMYNGREFGPPDIATYPILTNVIFERNSAVEGGGLFNENYVHATLTDVTFDSNMASRVGGGMEDRRGTLALTNVVFKNNTAGSPAGGAAGGLQIFSLEARLTNVTFSNNSAVTYGGGIANADGSPTLNPELTNVTFEGNSAEFGGGMYNYNSSPILTGVTFSQNSATNLGGGMANESSSNPELTNVSFSENTAVTAGGGIYNNSSSPSLMEITFHNNSAIFGGGMTNESNSYPELTNVTFNGNSAANYGGAIFNRSSSNPILLNATISGNIATIEAGGIANDNSSPSIINSILYGNSGGEIANINAAAPVVHHSIVQGGYAGPGNIDQDPLLGPLQNNSGFTETMALDPSSPAIDAGDDANCPAADQRGVTRPQRSHCDIGAYEYEGLDSAIDVIIGTSEVASYSLLPHTSERKSYPGINNGPVKIINTDGFSILAAERVIYKVKNIPTSFSEMTGLPDTQLDTTYWLPWYNNKDLDTQLRLANVSGSPATVQVSIGGIPMDSFNLAAGESIRKSYTGINNGPVKIDSSVDIVVAERVIYKINGINTSFSEMMALPNNQLDTTLWLPWYNNVDLDTQLRIANVSASPATIHVYIGGAEMQGSPFTLPAGESTRKSFAGINDGPVKIESDVDIVAAERVIYKVNGVNTSFSEMMALPNGQLDMTYWLPWYNNKDLDTQLRFANTTDQPATVHIYIGDQEMTGSPFTLPAGESTRQSFPAINGGPVQIVSDVPIVVAERVIYKVNGVNTSFSEMMALPNNLLDATFWFPWYNNVDLNTQLRFGLP